MLRILNIMANHLDFHEFVLLYGKGATVYQSMANKFNGHRLYESKGSTDVPYSIQQKPLVLTSVPNYLDANYVFDSDTIIKKVKTFPGSLIDLSAYADFDSYLTQTFSNKRRSYFNKCVNMLHTCFDISHRVYYGTMEREEYDSIFSAFQKMQSDRFEELGIKDDAMEMWPIYQKNTWQLVLDKKACISVIYNGSKPIAISLNYLLGKVVYGFTKTFDMAYAKFGLGNVELLKMIAWSIGEGFDVLDFMKGEYSYKNRFTDNPYSFLTQVVYSKKNLKQRVWGLALFMGLRVFYFMYHVYRFLGLHRFRGQKSHKKEKTSPVKSQELSKNASSILPTEIKIHLDAIKNKGFQKAVCDFCFMNKEPLKSIELFTTHEGEEYLKLISPSRAVLLTNSKSKIRR